VAPSTNDAARLPHDVGPDRLHQQGAVAIPRQRRPVDDPAEIPISVASLLRREGLRVPHTSEPPLQPRAHQLRPTEPSWIDRKLVRRAAGTAGALVAVASVFGAAVLSDSAGNGAPAPAPALPAAPAPSDGRVDSLPGLALLGEVPGSITLASFGQMTVDQDGPGTILLPGRGVPATTTVPGTSVPVDAPSGGLGGVVAGAGDYLGRSVSGVTETLGDTVSGTTGGLGSTVSGATDTLGDAVGGPLGDTVSGTGEAVGGLVEGVGSTLDDTVSGAGDALGTATGSLTGAVGGLLGGPTSSSGTTSGSAERRDPAPGTGGTGLLGSLGRAAAGLLGG
jgi:hypothetical protein